MRLSGAARWLLVSSVLLIQTVPASLAAHHPGHHRATRSGASADPDLNVQNDSNDSSLASHAGSYRAVALARRYYGCPYVHGGSSSRGFDCSGFTRFIYSRLGKSIPRTPQDQARRGKAVRLSELKAGDLLFFHTYRAGISHVGIYIGGGKFIHAESPRHGVTITELNSRYYRTRFVCARRP